MAAEGSDGSSEDHVNMLERERRIFFIRGVANHLRKHTPDRETTRLRENAYTASGELALLMTTDKNEAAKWSIRQALEELKYNDLGCAALRFGSVFAMESSLESRYIAFLGMILLQRLDAEMAEKIYHPHGARFLTPHSLEASGVISEQEKHALFKFIRDLSAEQEVRFLTIMAEHIPADNDYALLMKALFSEYQAITKVNGASASTISRLLGGSITLLTAAHTLELSEFAQAYTNSLLPLQQKIAEGRLVADTVGVLEHFKMSPKADTAEQLRMTSREVEKLKTLNGIVMGQLKLARDQLAQAQEALKAETDKVATAETKIVKLKSELATAAQQYREQAQMHTDFRQQITALSAQLAEMRASATHSSELYQRDLKLRERYEVLEKRFAEAEKATRELAQFKVAQKSEVKRLRATLEALQERHTTSETEISRLRGEIETLKATHATEVSVLDSQLQTAQTHIERLESWGSVWQTRGERYLKTLEEAREQTALYTKQIEQLRIENARLRANIADEIPPVVVSIMREYHHRNMPLVSPIARETPIGSGCVAGASQ